MWFLLLLYRFQFYYYFVNHTNEEILFHCDVIFISNRTKLKSSKRHNMASVWAGLTRQRPNDKHQFKLGSQECRVHAKCQKYKINCSRSGCTMKLKRFCVPMIGMKKRYNNQCYSIQVSQKNEKPETTGLSTELTERCWHNKFTVNTQHNCIMQWYVIF